MFSKLKLLKLDDLYKHKLCISTNRQLPDSMSSMVIPIHNVHVIIISEIELDNTSSKLELTAGHLQYITLAQYSGTVYTLPQTNNFNFHINYIKEIKIMLLSR